jgi:hypothetical protein
MELLLCLFMCIANAACLVIGVVVGQKVSRGERIELPSIDPMKAVREKQDRKQAEAERERYETIMRNIENYDGTGANQEDVPRG